MSPAPKNFKEVTMTDALVETAEWLAWISEPVSDLTADEIKAWANRQPRRYQLQPVLPREGEWVTVKFSQEAKSRAYELVEQAAAAAGGYEVTDITILRALNAAAPPSPDRQGEVSWLKFLPSDKEWLADHGRKMGSGVGQQAIERLLVALDRVAASDRQGEVEAKLDADWFDEVEDMLDDYSDAEIIDGTTHPNKAMRLLYQLREARGR